MNPCDLMIGDIVKIGSNVCRVEGIIGADGYTPYLVEFTFAGLFNESLQKSDLESVQPIPLTPEILEKNGWKITGCKDAKYYWHDDVPFHIPIEPYNHWREDEDRIFADDFFDSVFIRLGYVHELQHLLKLLRIDKEIVL